MELSIKRVQSKKMLLVMAWILVALNAMDGIFTYIALKNNIAEEANPILASLPPEVLLAIKLLFSVFLMFFLLKTKQVFQKTYIFVLLSIALMMYIGVTGIHFVWIYLTLF